MRPGIWRTNALAAGEEADVRAAERERQAERLALGDDDVGAVRARRAVEREADGIGGDDVERAGIVRGLAQRAASVDAAEEVGLLRRRGTRVSSVHRERARAAAGTSTLDVDGRRAYALHNVRSSAGARARRRRCSAAGDDAGHEARPRRAAVAPSYMPALATSMPGELADDRLELEDGLERALRDLGLVGRVAV